MNSKKSLTANDGSSVYERFEEKTQLQNLNQRYTNYFNTIRQRRENEACKVTYAHDEKKWSSQIETMRCTYDQQVADLRNQLTLLRSENNELEGRYSQHCSMSTEYQGRISSLNETVLKQTDQIAKLQMSLTNKEIEFQQFRSQLAGPQAELEACKLEREDLKRRLSEAERRFHAEQIEKFECQHKFTDFRTRTSQEILLFKQEISDLQESSESSRRLVINMEESAKISGLQSGDITQMMANAREASAMDLKRYMENSEMKHNLNISEIKIQMETDAKTVTALVEENGRLRTDLNNAMAELSMTQSKLTAVESAYKMFQGGLDSERKRFEIRIQQLDKKLQETQELLLVKIKELNLSQDANIPLKAEIEFLKKLIDEEEKRLYLESNYSSAFGTNASVKVEASTKLQNWSSNNQQIQTSHLAKFDRKHQELSCRKKK